MTTTDSAAPRDSLVTEGKDEREREKLNVDIFVAVSRRLLVTKRLRVSSANIDKGVDGVKPSF